MKMTDLEKLQQFRKDFCVNLLAIQMRRKGKPFTKEYFDHVLKDIDHSNKFKHHVREFIAKYFPNGDE